MTAEYTSKGWIRLFNCYSIGEKYLNTILKQDVLKSEKRVATGRRAKNIRHHTIANMKNLIIILGVMAEIEFKTEKKNNINHYQIYLHLNL